MDRKLGGLILWLSACGCAFAQDTAPAIDEEWRCRQDSYAPNDEVIAVVWEGRQAGYIDAAGSKQYARFSVDGLDRRWDFGCTESGCRYSLLIAPNRSAKFYDFSLKSEATPSKFLTCIRSV